MIYIDPPYNTGSDGFAYNDLKKFTKEELAELTDISEEAAERILSFGQKGAASHSAWLAFMYPRLSLARDFLRDDGVIFISIDDNEAAQLKLLCDEIYGADNFVSQITRIAKRTSDKGTHFRPTKDYIFAYAKNILSLPEFGIAKEIKESDYRFSDTDGRRYKKSGASLYQPSLDPLRGCSNQRYYIKAPDGSLIIPPGNVFPADRREASKIKPESSEDKVWRWSDKTYLAEKDKLIFTKGSARNPLIDANGNQSKWNVYPKVFLEEDIGASLHPEDVIYDFPNSMATKELIDLKIPTNMYPKPSGLIKYLLMLFDTKEGLIMDFFAGSGSSAEGVLKANAEDNGNRAFICIQLDELIKIKGANSSEYKTIFDVTKKRIKRCEDILIEDKKISEEDRCHIYKLVESPFKDKNKDLSLEDSSDGLFATITDKSKLEAILTTWKLRDGYELSVPIETIKLADYEAYLCGNHLYLINPDFSHKALLELVTRFGNDKEFQPRKLVVLDVNMDTALRLELDSALKGFKNKNSDATLDLIVRV